MEQSLRRALDAGDATDPAFRETIYAASERALERMIVQRPMDEAEAQAQRIRLAETINRVEQDYYAAAPENGEAMSDEAWRQDPDHEAGDAAVLDAAQTGFEEDRGRPPDEAPPEAGPARASNLDPDLGLRPAAVSEAADADPTPSFLRRSSDAPAPRTSSRDGRADAAGRRPASSSGFGSGTRLGSGQRLGLALLVVLLAFAILAYFVYGMIYGPTSSEAAGTASSSDGSGTDDAGREWIALFDGTQLGSIATRSGGRVEAVTGAGERPAVRLSSAGEGTEIEVAVGPGVVGELAGETVRVEVTVGSPDGEPREFGVRCLFDGETACGRQRFTTVQSSESFVFDMTVPQGARSAGSIAFDPGYGPGAKALDLYGVRARHQDQA